MRFFSTRIKVFDRSLKLKQRLWASRMPDPEQYDYLRDHVAEQLADRLNDIPRTFTRLVDLGSGAGQLSKFLAPCHLTGLIQCDASWELMDRGQSVRDLSAPSKTIWMI